MAVIGLIGGPGAGKSHVAGVLKGFYPVALIEADKVGHRLLAQDPQVRSLILSAFGPGVLDREGGIDRTALGAVVFFDRDKKETLDSIMLPRIKESIQKEIESLTQADPHMTIVVDGALLVEAGCGELLDNLWYVHADASTRRKRLVEDRGIPPERAEAMLKSQAPDAFYLAHADAVIDNSQGRSGEELEVEVGMALEKLKRNGMDD
ncbi:dephospho-CoA kinase [Anaerotalea alkaliphila]|uniref:Dephospho-CoA kinase n=1 Tax=Anaerotalea alkaliphila TaxID=2662126 RepID=A0A7X5HXT9_9FIRM|nr:dephospho-CoA kinase [Anaerotalea alkaliphila]NDL68630.1 dephospho-CoA kinase [Anaerotalea alkaliphila]